MNGSTILTPSTKLLSFMYIMRLESLREISKLINCLLNAHIRDATLTYFQYDVKFKVQRKMSSRSPEFERKSNESK